jgi:hypothetical protein
MKCHRRYAQKKSRIMDLPQGLDLLARERKTGCHQGEVTLKKHHTEISGNQPLMHKNFTQKFLEIKPLCRK